MQVYPYIQKRYVSNTKTEFILRRLMQLYIYKFVMHSQGLNPISYGYKEQYKKLKWTSRLYVCTLAGIVFHSFLGVLILDESVGCCGTSKAFTVAHALPVLLLLLSGDYQ